MSSTVANRRTIPITIAPLIEKCLENERNRSLSERSLKELRIQFTIFISFCISKKVIYVKALSARFFKSFAGFIAKKGCPGQTKAAVWAIRKFGNYLALFQYLPVNPAANIPHPKMSPRAKLPEYLKPDELHKYLETALTTRSMKEITAISLLATIGLRPNEIASLKIKDIDFKRELLRVTVKGGWVKVMPLNSVMIEYFNDYLENTEFPGEYLFYNTWGKPIDNRWVLRLSKAVGKAAGIAIDVTPRVMRHTFATYMADRHGKQVTRAFLGHGASKSTDVYMHLVPGKFRKYANKHPYKRIKRRGMK